MLDKTVTDWQAIASELNIEGRAFLNGSYVDALSGETRPTLNPANGNTLADVAVCGAEDAEVAVGHARASFESGAWSAMAPADRKMILVRWSELIDEHVEELALLESLQAAFGLETQTLARYCAPWVEEIFKGLIVVWALRPHHRLCGSRQRQRSNHQDHQ